GPPGPWRWALRSQMLRWHHANPGARPRDVAFGSWAAVRHDALILQHCLRQQTLCRRDSAPLEVESRKGAVAGPWASPVSPPTGSPEAVTRPRFPQNVACGFPAPTLFGSWFTALRAPAAPNMGGAV